MRVDLSSDPSVRESASLPLSLGGLGLRSAVGLRKAAFWASWCDCLPMIKERHPTIASQLLRSLEGRPERPNLQAAVNAQLRLIGVLGFAPLVWRAVMHGARPHPQEVDHFQFGAWMDGWQHEATSRVDTDFRQELFTRVDERTRALIRSQGGSGAGLCLHTCSMCLITRFEPQHFRVILLRRLRQPLPLTQHSCLCGHPRPLWPQPRSLCQGRSVGKAWLGPGKRGSPDLPRSWWTRYHQCLLRDLDLAPNAVDGRRLEVVVGGLPLFGGAQLAIDTTMVCSLHSNGQPRRRAGVENGVVLAVARQRKERTYAELVGPNARARLVVLGVEVGGRWSEETRCFLSLLARAKSRGETWLMRRRVEQAWRLRWRSLLACVGVRAGPCPCLICLVPEVLTATHLLDMRSRETSSMVQSEDFPCVLLTNGLVTHSSHCRLLKKSWEPSCATHDVAREKNACCVHNFMLNVVSCLQTRRSEGNRYCLKAQHKKKIPS